MAATNPRLLTYDVSRVGLGMRSRNPVTAIILLMLALLTGCSRLGFFDTIAPKDGGAVLEARGLSYGADARQKLDIYRPAGGDKNAPTLVFVYGGSWNSGRRQEYSFVGRAFASRGFVTVIADYRLVPEHLYPAFVQDSAKAVAWTYRNIASYGGNPKKLYVVGHSAGAYNAMMVALNPRFLGDEGLPLSIIDAAAGLSGPYDFLPLDVDETRAAFRGVANLENTQPVNWAGRGRKPPVFVATGDADEFVKPRNTQALAAALRRSGNRVEEKSYPGVDHVGTLLAISRPLRGNAPVLDDIVAFLMRN